MRSLKNPTLGRGNSRETDIEGGHCLKREAWAVKRIRGGLGKKEEVVFSRGD